MDPPVYNPETDFQVWRKQIESWVDLISAATEKGTDKMYKTIFATLGRQLYDRGLPEAQKHIVDEAQQKGLIDYRQDNQVEAVRQIVELLAVDPPIAVVTRLINSFNKVSQCRRRRNEDLNSFVSRFRGLAAQRLMNAGVGASSQIGEVLGIHLLNNADLGENTLTNAKIQLVSMAEAREQAQSKDQKNFDTLTDDVSSLKDIETSLASAANEQNRVKKTDERKKVVQTVFAYRKAIREEISKLTEARNQLIGLPPPDAESTKSSVSALLQKKPRKLLLLDGAVTGIRSLAYSTSKESSSTTKREVETIVGQRLHKALSATQRASPEQFSAQSQRVNRKRKTASKAAASGSSNQSPKAKVSRVRINQGPKPDSQNEENQGDDDEEEHVCFDCGKTGPRRGNENCKRMSWLTKQINARHTGRNVGEKPSSKATRSVSFFEPSPKDKSGK